MRPLLFYITSQGRNFGRVMPQHHHRHASRVNLFNINSEEITDYNSVCTVKHSPGVLAYPWFRVVRARGFRSDEVGLLRGMTKATIT